MTPHTTAPRRPIAALLLVAAFTAVLPARAQAGQLLERAAGQAALEPVAARPRGTTRVIVRTERGALSAVLRLVTTLGGRVVAQHDADRRADRRTAGGAGRAGRAPSWRVERVARLAGGQRADRRHRSGRIAPGRDARAAGQRAPPHRAGRPRHRRRRDRLGVVGQRRLPDPPLRRLHQAVQRQDLHGDTPSRPTTTVTARTSPA